MANDKFNVGSLFGDKDLNNLITRADNFISNLPSQQVTSNKIDDTNVFNNVMSSVEGEKEDDSQIKEIINHLAIPFERQNRYKVYDDIYSSVQLIKSIIRVYKNNILQKDAINPDVISLIKQKDTQNNELDLDKVKTFCKSFIKHFQFELKLSDRMVPDLLKYGDHFIEVIDLKNDIQNLPDGKSNKLITGQGLVYETVQQVESELESLNQNKNGNKYSTMATQSILESMYTKLVNLLLELGEVQSNDTDVLLSEYFENIDSDGDPSDKDVKNSLSNILSDPLIFKRFLLRFHNPRNIVVLETHYGTTIGYVEIKETKNTEITGGIAIRFAQLLSQIGAGLKTNTQKDTVVAIRLVNTIVSRIIQHSGVTKDNKQGKNPKESNKQFEEDLRKKLGDEIFYQVKRLYIEANPEQSAEETLSKLRFRFIPTDHIVKCSYNINEYAPYGTSVIDALVYPAKLYLLTQMANVVTKLSRAAVMRKWVLETGPREQSSGLIQKLKKELRNQRITAQNLLSFKSIPRIMSDFKDIVLLSKQNRRFLDVEVMQTGDANIKMQDLEDVRRELIALSGIPAPYLGYNDIVELREQLVNINITFANEVIGLQFVINKAMEEVFDIIGLKIDEKFLVSKYVKPQLKPPVILLLQMLETVLSSISNIQQSFTASGIKFDPYYILTKYVPQLDWDAFKQAAKDYEVQTNLSGGEDQQGVGGRF